MAVAGVPAKVIGPAGNINSRTAAVDLPTHEDYILHADIRHPWQVNGAPVMERNYEP